MSAASPGGAIPALVLGGSGYVAGELLRLLAGHPHFRLAGILSDSKPGEAVAHSFGHLAAAYPEHLLQLAAADRGHRHARARSSPSSVPRRTAPPPH